MRVEAAAGLADAFVPGAVVVLVPERTAEPGSLGWVGACGKTQLAVCVAESLWRPGTVELLVWITATSRAGVLAALAEAAEDVLGADFGGSGELLARRFLGWPGARPLFPVPVYPVIRKKCMNMCLFDK